MEDSGLSKEELERALKFEGYGNKSAPFWFIGMEEGGGSIEQLRKRVRQYDSVEYLHGSPAKIGLETKYLHVPTWRVMSKLIMAMQGTRGWQETSSAREYQASKLGRADGDTFLTELMPLPSPSIGVWPYGSFWPSREEYYEEVRPGRIKWLRSEVSECQPRYVICYGKGNWPNYEEIFSGVEFMPELNEKIKTGQNEHSKILLLPFFSYRYVSAALITQIAALPGRDPN